MHLADAEKHPFGVLADADRQRKRLARARHRKRRFVMSALDCFFTTLFVLIYFFLLFTVCLMTFQKGHVVLGILGIFVPFLWLIGAILPAKPGSRYQIAEAMRYQSSTGQMTP
jgi:hypothetical protein